MGAPVPTQLDASAAPGVLVGRTAASQGLITCTSCQLVCSVPQSGWEDQWACPRCAATLHSRKPASLSRTWALIIAAAVFYIPANVLHITVSSKLGTSQSDTILSGVIYFLKTGSWHIGLIIFTASIMVPIIKLVVLVFLMISIHRHSAWNPVRRTRLFRLIELIGRWSMVDIFVVTIAVSLVKLGLIASVQAGPGIVFFGAVVVLTMLAAYTFDPRLIWDAGQTTSTPRLKRNTGQTSSDSRLTWDTGETSP